MLEYLHLGQRTPAHRGHLLSLHFPSFILLLLWLHSFKFPSRLFIHKVVGSTCRYCSYQLIILFASPSSLLVISFLFSHLIISYLLCTFLTYSLSLLLYILPLTSSHHHLPSSHSLLPTKLFTFSFHINECRRK